MANFIDPTTLADASASRADANGQSAIIDELKKVFSRGPRQGDPVALAKAAKASAASRAADPNRDDAVAKDEDLDDDEDEADLDEDDDQDAAASDTERADLKTRRKLRAKADRQKAARDQSHFDAAAKAIKKIHREGARREDPDCLIKRAATTMRYRDSRPSFTAIKKAQSNPMSMEKLFAQGSNNHPIDMTAVQRIVARGKNPMRKGTPTFRPTFPPNSSNQSLTNRPLADTGAGNDWDDEGTQRPSTERVGGHNDRTVGPNDVIIRAAVASTNSRANEVAAIKQDWAAAKRKQAQAFANRPAARVGSDDMGNPA